MTIAGSSPSFAAAVGRPRRVGERSMTSSWTRVAAWVSSTAIAAGATRSKRYSPRCAQSRTRAGRKRLPPLAKRSAMGAAAAGWSSPNEPRITSSSRARSAATGPKVASAPALIATAGGAHPGSPRNRRFRGVERSDLVPEVDLADLGDLLAEQDVRDLVEAVGHCGHQQLMPGLGPIGGAHARVVKPALHHSSGGLRGVDELEGAWIDALDGRLEQRVMRAAEHQHVGAHAGDLGQVPLQRPLGPGRVGVAGLHDLDQLRAGFLIDADHGVELFDRVQILLAERGALGRD